MLDHLFFVKYVCGITLMIERDLVMRSLLMSYLDNFDVKKEVEALKTRGILSLVPRPTKCFCILILSKEIYSSPESGSRY